MSYVGIGLCPRPRAAVGVALIVAAAAAGAAAIDDAPLTFAEAVQLAQERQPMLERFDAQARAARAAAVSAAQLPDPKLVGGVQDLPIDGRDAGSFSDDSDTQVIVGVSQEFPTATKRRLRGELRTKEADRLDDERTAAARTVQRDAANAWIDVWYATRAQSIVSASLRDSELQRDAVQIAVGASTATQAELLTVRVATERNRDALAAREQAIGVARAALYRWIGAAADRPVPTEEPALAVPMNDDAIAVGLRDHPQLAALQAQVDEADVGARLAEAAYAPDWRVEFGYGNRREFSDMIVLKVGMDLPLFTRNRQDRELESALALRDAAEAERDDVRRTLDADVRRSRGELAALTERVRTYDAAILPEAGQAIDAALAAWRTGKGSLAQVLEARRARLDARLAQLELMAAAAHRKVDLQYLAGGAR